MFHGGTPSKKTYFMPQNWAFNLILIISIKNRVAIGD
jgi:hypothetical protein